MTETEAYKSYDIIRTYYNFYTPKRAFIDTYLKEFEKAPEGLISECVKKYCERGERQPPTITDIKSILLRKKWALQSRYNEKRKDGSLKRKEALQLIETIDGINTTLDGYGSELEEEDARQVREYRNKYGEPKPRKPYTEEELQEAEEKLLSIGELYDL